MTPPPDAKVQPQPNRSSELTKADEKPTTNTKQIERPVQGNTGFDYSKLVKWTDA